MTMIVAGQPAKITVTVKVDGSPIPISGAVNRMVYSLDGRTEMIGPVALDSEAAGADWANGVVVVEFDAADTTGLTAGDAMLILQGEFGIKRFRLDVETLVEPVRTSLFIRDLVVDELRRDRLVAAASGAFPDVPLSDDYLWDKLRAAESEIAHTLRVPLVPTRFFPQQPTQEQLDELDGMAWELESSPDYYPDMFAGDRWGFILLRNKPVISIERMRFVYPTEANGHYDIPLDWLSIDKKYGHVRIVPTSNAILTGLAGLTMLGMQAGRTIPSMIRITYTAGLTDVANTYPELIDCIKKLAVVKLVSDLFLPQSGSISADGLSESMSVDMAKYHETIDHILNGPDGSNGGLMAQIHGVRAIVI